MTDQDLANITMIAGYLGKRCIICKDTFETLDDLNKAVIAQVQPIELAHQICWEAVNPPAKERTER